MTEEELIQRTRELTQRWDDLKIVGQGWAGNARLGFQFNPIRTRGGGGGTPPVTGACCFEDGSCAQITAAQCASVGGDYQGDGTVCTPNPCPQPPGCRHDEDICVTFSGIESCGCYLVATGNTILLVDIDLNGSFPLTKTADGGGIVQWNGFGGTCLLRRFSGAPGESCPDDPPGSECIQLVTRIIVQCIGPPSDPTTSHFLGYTIPRLDICGAPIETQSINIFTNGFFGNGNIVFGASEPTLNDCIDTSHGMPLANLGTVIYEGSC